MRLFTILATCLVILVAAAPRIAQAEDGVFASYEELRKELDNLMGQRRIKELMLAFGGADEMTVEQLEGLEGRVRAIYPRNFDTVSLLRRVEMQEGWRQELLVYWYDYSYVYAYLLLHQKADEIVSVTFRFNSDFDEINAAF